MNYSHQIIESYFPEEELTRYGFISEMEHYIKQLLQNPISAKVSDRLKKFGIDEEKALSMLLKRENPADENSAVLIRSEKIRPEELSDEDKKNNVVPKDRFYVKYKLPRRDYLKKMRRLYIDEFENNSLNEESLKFSFGKNRHGLIDKKDVSIDSLEDIYEIEIGNKTYTYPKHEVNDRILGECDGGDGIGGGATSADASGQYVAPLMTKPIKKKTIYVTKEQVAYVKKRLNEDSPAVVGTQFGDFGYDAPAFAKKGDLSLDHNNMIEKSVEDGK